MRKYLFLQYFTERLSVGDVDGRKQTRSGHGQRHPPFASVCYEGPANPVCASTPTATTTPISYIIQCNGSGSGATLTITRSWGTSNVSGVNCYAAPSSVGGCTHAGYPGGVGPICPDNGTCYSSGTFTQNPQDPTGSVSGSLTFQGACPGTTTPVILADPVGGAIALCSDEASSLTSASSVGPSLSKACVGCPCPETCSRAAVFCGWVEAGADDVQRRHIFVDTNERMSADFGELSRAERLRLRRPFSRRRSLFSFGGRVRPFRRQARSKAKQPGGWRSVRRARCLTRLSNGVASAAA